MSNSNSGNEPKSQTPSRLLLAGLFLLSAATLTFETTLTRLFSVAQFYHFAFMVVSLALLGFGASGTTLAIVPRLGRGAPRRTFILLSLACSIAILGAYLLTNWLPFDSFSIAWDLKQVGILVLHYLALALPFYFSGMAVGMLLAASPGSAGRTYAANLTGSAAGCAVALIAPSGLGGEGTVVLSCGMAALAAVIASEWGLSGINRMAGLLRFRRVALRNIWCLALAIALLLFFALDFSSRLLGRPLFSFLELRISPYKSLSYALQYPDSRLVFQRWNAFSRVDVVRSALIRSLPGLSYRYSNPLPPEDGLLVDGDDLSPVPQPGADLEFTDYLPSAVAFRLRPQADVLVLEPRGGVDVLAALAGGARHVTAVEVNPLIVQAAANSYNRPDVDVVIDSGRSFTRRAKEQYDVLLLSLATSYHPVHSGAYTLAEDYRFTVESFQDALRRLNPGGLLVVTRWLQSPPSECLRTFALAVTALEGAGQSPQEQIVAFRGYNTATILVKNEPYTPEELETIREFAASRAFDLVYAPGIDPGEVNRYNILPQPVYSQAFAALLEAQPRRDFYRAYPYEVSPPTDDRPFFGHYFKWSQAGEIWAELGKTWQPFGGAGYFVVLALLILATLLAIALILLPAVFARQRFNTDQAPRPMKPASPLPYLFYFACIGFAYLLVEIPLIQRFILFLGQPAYALTAVLFTLLLFSGVGSRLEGRVSLPVALAGLLVLLFALPSLLPLVFNLTLGLPFGIRLALTVIILAPIGLLMGIPFPGGIRWLTATAEPSRLIPWVWGVNGAASVISAILAALLALSFGFGWVLRIGALFYASAWLTAMASNRRAAAASPPP